MLCLLKSFLIFLLCLRFSVLCLFYNYFNCFSVSYDISAFLFFFKMFFVDLFLPLLLLLLLLSRFSRVRLCATPKTRQPTRLPRPWDSPGKSTGVGCHVLLQCMKVKKESEVAQSCPTLSDPMDCSLPDSSIHGIFQARVLEWGAIEDKASACNAGDPGSIPELGRSPG